jgi:hypothetical protein
MSLAHSPKVVTDGLVFYYDMGNTQKSWKGVPTTNLNSGVGIGTYLNTPSDVTSSLTLTGEFYRGSPIYKQVLTPITATGVGYLTNAGNPGIGVVTGGGGGLAGRYTGHSIFFKAEAGRTGLNSSTPIYTHYSNIGGWQSTGNFDNMGDGWYRAHVIYYNASGGSDGKYWAINPAGATLNVPITIYWAAPFKEDRNDSAFVSPYVYSARSSTEAVVDLTGNNAITANALTYNSDGTFSINNIAASSLSIPDSSITRPAGLTISAWVKMNVYNPLNDFDGSFPTIAWKCNTDNSGGGGSYGLSLASPNPRFAISSTQLISASPLTYGVWVNLIGTYSAGGTMILYRNGAVDTSTTGPTSIPYSAQVFSVGSRIFNGGYQYPWNGNIGSVQLYNRALTADEVKQNFNALKGRYGL